MPYGSTTTPTDKYSNITEVILNPASREAVSKAIARVHTAVYVHSLQVQNLQRSYSLSDENHYQALQNLYNGIHDVIWDTPISGGNPGDPIRVNDPALMTSICHSDVPAAAAGAGGYTG
jgi:hypothetical protein